jgi:hypothetical protein
VEAAAFAVLGTLALAVVVAAMVLGIVVMAHKG